MKKAVFSLLLFAILPQSGITQGVRIHNGFMKAEDFLHMSTDSRRDYAMGIVDGMLLAPAFGAPDKGQKVQSFGACIEGMDDSQVAAIIEKFLRDRPERWNERLNLVVFAAMMEACSKK